MALGADLVLLVLDGDLTTPEAEALELLLASGKPLLLVLNRIDCWPEAEHDALLASIRRRLPASARHLELLAVASAPRRPELLADGRVRSVAGAPGSSRCGSSSPPCWRAAASCCWASMPCAPPIASSRACSAGGCARGGPRPRG